LVAKMAKTRVQKEKIIEELTNIFSENKGIVFFDYQGLNNSELFELRKSLKNEHAGLKVTKATLLKIALARNKVELKADFKRPLALTFAKEDEIAPFRKVAEFLKTKEKGEILAGFIDASFTSKEEALRLALLPGRSQLQSSLLFGMIAPLNQLLFILRESQSQLLRLLKSYEEQLSNN